MLRHFGWWFRTRRCWWLALGFIRFKRCEPPGEALVLRLELLERTFQFRYVIVSGRQGRYRLKA